MNSLSRKLDCIQLCMDCNPPLKEKNVNDHKKIWPWPWPQGIILQRSPQSLLTHPFQYIVNIMSKEIPVIHSSVVPPDQESGQATIAFSDTETCDQRRNTDILSHYDSYGKFTSSKHEYRVETRRFCRVCWDVKEDVDTLVSPCCCSGAY